jgi:hypothetical protein
MDNNEKILKLLNSINLEIGNIKIKLEHLDEKVSNIDYKIDNQIKNDCKKMSEHIDFIENVYENVKNPLGFICNKLNFYATEDYTLENIKKKDNDDK